MMLVLTLLVRGGGAYEFTSKAELKAACEMWVTDQSTAQATYGHISTFGIQNRDKREPGIIQSKRPNYTLYILERGATVPHHWNTDLP